MERPCEKVDRALSALEGKKRRGELSQKDVLELLKRL